MKIMSTRCEVKKRHVSTHSESRLTRHNGWGSSGQTTIWGGVTPTEVFRLQIMSLDYNPYFSVYFF
jgi:hypothetical protein